MAFASGPVTFRRFFVSGNVSARVNDEFIKALQDHVFGHHGAAAPDGTEVGWIAPTHLFDIDITEHKIVYDRFVYLQMRLDRTAAPSSLIRSYTAIEEQAALDASGREFLSKRERGIAKEKAVLRAEKESSADMHRRVGAVPVLIDLPAKTVFFGNLGSAAADKFIGLFSETFDASLEPATSEHVAYRIMDAAGDPRAVEDAIPSHLIAAPRVEEDDAFALDDRTFFGREFLTWLWFRTETQRSQFDLNEPRASSRADTPSRAPDHNLAVMISTIMQLDCDFKMTGSDTIRCDGPGASAEARAALPLGKQPTKIGLMLGGASAEFALVLDGPKFNVSALRLPEPEQTDRRAILEERFEHITQAAGLLDMLFALFLGKRASADWPAELAQIKTWALGLPNGEQGGDDLTLRFPSEATA